MFGELIQLHLIELAVLIFLIPFVALHVFLAMKSRTEGKPAFAVLTVLMAIVMFAGLGFGAFWGVLMISFILWPPSY